MSKITVSIVIILASCCLLGCDLASSCLAGCDDTTKEETENVNPENLEPDSGVHQDNPTLDGDTESEDLPEESRCNAGEQTCSLTAPCDSSNVCSSEMFPENEGFLSGKCYPKCQPDHPLSDCCPKGSICMALDKMAQSLACLETGTADRQNLSIKLLPAGKKPNHQDVTFTRLKTSVGGQNIPLNMSYGIESFSDFDRDGIAEEVVILEFEGAAGLLGTWVLQITIPAHLWQSGVLRGALWDDTSQFDALLSKWVGQEMTVHAVLREGTITIREPGTVCDKAPCAKTDIDIALQLIAIKATRNSSS